MNHSENGLQSETPISIYRSSDPIETKLDRARMELSDLSARDRLLNIPRSSKSVRTIEIVDEKALEVFRLLVKENRAFSFIPGRAAEITPLLDGIDQIVELEEVEELAQPDDETVDGRGILTRHADTKLQTRLTSKGLQRRLLDFYVDARTLEDEHGVNLLYLALGTLKWPSNRSWKPHMVELIEELARPVII